MITLLVQYDYDKDVPHMIYLTGLTDCTSTFVSYRIGWCSFPSRLGDHQRMEREIVYKTCKPTVLINLILQLSFPAEGAAHCCQIRLPHAETIHRPFCCETSLMSNPVNGHLHTHTNMLMQEHLELSWTSDFFSKILEEYIHK